jgi:uncharacterized metal-binding protein YceD (DUF177 family)
MSDERRVGRDGGQFKIDVEGLKRAPAIFDCDIPVAWLSEELAACEYPVEPASAHLSAEVTLTDSGVLVNGEATARVKAECGACLADVHLDLTAPLSAFLVPRPDGAEEQGAEFTPDDLEREWFDGGRFALDGLVRDGLMLELPITPHCEGECRGEAAAHLSKAVRQMDPRLAPLASIRLAKEK